MGTRGQLDNISLLGLYVDTKDYFLTSKNKEEQQ